MPKASKSGQVLGGRRAGDGRRLISLGGNCPGIAGAVLELDEVAFSCGLLNATSSMNTTEPEGPGLRIAENFWPLLPIIVNGEAGARPGIITCQLNHLASG